MDFLNIIAGFLSGVAASMGLGGGFILIIYLTAFSGVSQLDAGGINLLFFLPIALISIIIHTKNKLVEWKIILPICISGAFGVGIGAILITLLDEGILGKLFGVLLLVVGLKEIFHKKAEKA